MSTYSQRNKKAVIITVFAAIIFVMLIVALIYNLVRVAALNSRTAELKKQIEEMDELIAAQQADIDYRSTDEFVDAYAREYLGMIGEDEIAFIAK